MKLRTYLAIFFLFSIAFCDGQVYIFSKQDEKWTPKEFIQNNITIIKAYNYRISKKGKVKRDSTLLYKQIFNKDLNEVSGINYDRIYLSHGPSQIRLYHFKNKYDKENQLISSTSYILPKKEKKRKRYKSSTSLDYLSVEYIYDDQANITTETHKAITEYYEISQKDTILTSRSIHPTKIYDHLYKNGLLVMGFESSDSIKTINYINNIVKSTCNKCILKYKSFEKQYNENGNLKLSIRYTKNGDLHTKRFYYYDNLNRLIKELDSTGWYLSNFTKPYLDRKTEISYTEKGKTVTKTIYKSYPIIESIFVNTYDNHNHLLSECTSYTDNKHYCKSYKYIFKDNKISKIIATLENGIEMINYFLYDKNGRLVEESVICENKVKEMVRYFYE